MQQSPSSFSIALQRVRKFYLASSRIRGDVGLGNAIGALAAVLALMMRFALGNFFEGSPFITFLLAVILSSLLVSWRAGAVSAAVGGLLAWYFLLDPPLSLQLTGSGAIGLGFFFFTSLVIVLLTGAIHQTFDDIAASEGQLQKLNQELEEKVAQRTAKLAETVVQLRAEINLRESAEARLRQMEKMEAIGQLTGGIAHDFNNMLAVIMASLDLAKRHMARDLTRVEHFIESAFDGTRRAAELTARLLAFSRQQALEPKSLDLNQLVSGMTDMLTRTLGETIRLEVVLAAGLWKVFADPAQLSTALINLCANSRDAMPSGGRLTVETSNAYLDDDYSAAHAEIKSGQYVLLAVSDTGSGMAPDTLQKAFEPFYTTKSVGRGTGLGLSQVYGFVKQSNGHIKLYSEINQGTTVKVYLPRCIQVPMATGEALPQETPKTGSPNEVILIVEDDERVRRMSQEALVELGYTVIAMSHPSEALAFLRTNPLVTLLFTDIVMPDMNGRQLAEAALKLCPHLKVLYTTGYTRNAIVHNGLVDHGVVYLQKPFSINQLSAKIRLALDA